MIARIYPNPFFHGCWHDFEPLRELYEYPPQPESLRRRWQNLKEPVHRRRLARILRDYNRRLGAPGEALANIELLEQSGTPVVIGGQQAGLFTGPLLTVYKALEIINLAGRASQLLGRKVVPVFWVAGDDHDFNEINHINLFDTSGELRRISLPGTGGARPAGLIPVAEEFQQAVTELAALTPPTEFKDGCLELLRRSGEQAPDLAAWFARVLTELLGRLGLVLFDPLMEGGAELRGEFFNRFWEHRKEFYTALEDAAAGVRRLGFPLQVEKDPAHANMFVLLGQERRAVYWDGEYCRTRARAGRDGRLRLQAEDFRRWVGQDPGRFSPDVLLRPLFQDFIFPVLASVNGPAEIAYQAQLRPAYRALAIEQPPLFPRRGLTIVEKHCCRHLDRWQVSAAELMKNSRQVLDELLRRRSPVQIDELFTRARAGVEGIYRDLLPGLVVIDPRLQGLGEENRRRVQKELDYLYRKACHYRLPNEENLLRQFHGILGRLLPRGKLQERVVNVFSYLIRYGPELLVHLQQALTGLEGAHGLLRTDGALLWTTPWKERENNG